MTKQHTVLSVHGTNSNSLRIQPWCQLFYLYICQNNPCSEIFLSYPSGRLDHTKLPKDIIITRIMLITRPHDNECQILYNRGHFRACLCSYVSDYSSPPQTSHCNKELRHPRFAGFDLHQTKQKNKN